MVGQVSDRVSPTHMSGGVDMYNINTIHDIHQESNKRVYMYVCMHLAGALHPHVALDAHVVDADPQGHIRSLHIALIDNIYFWYRGPIVISAFIRATNDAPTSSASAQRPRTYLGPPFQGVQQLLIEAAGALERADQMDGAPLPCVCGGDAHAVCMHGACGSISTPTHRRGGGPMPIVPIIQ